MKRNEVNRLEVKDALQKEILVHLFSILYSGIMKPRSGRFKE